ncbi:diacylglycerol lipase-alpha-like isoform X2 [Mercenaria mercenaria]|uniref:diacylglycerol lipase-alpha-like isoform X2 n=1 Tax=Mercenaria mercenaria TaxID=6596 RepID=UPI00234FA15F|nr:diacylglycerol lipase-alpha-like isoform X2 [Mercenaria mercenaria]
MPGIVVFGRRWSVGSDDMVLPALFMVVVHVIWLAALSYIFTKVEFDTSSQCSRELKDIVLGYIVILLACLIVESIVTLISVRGSILDTEPRISMQYLLYVRIVVFLGELAWLVVSIRWIVRFYFNCRPDDARKAILGISIFNGCMILMCITALWCTFDSAGRKWVKFKRYQESMKEKAHRSRRSGSARRNWRQRDRQQHYQCQYMQRKAMRAYEESWDRRLGLMCCCVERKGRNKNSMSEIAQLFTEFFRDLDVVPSDVIAGLVLLRRFQKLRMEFTINQEGNDVYRYLSGVAVTPRTQFLQLGQPEVMQQYKLVIHYMKFAMAAYGWPIFMMMNTGTGLCRIMPYLRCCCCQNCCKKGGVDYELDDNCCQCNVVALKKISGLPDMDLVYVTYHVDIGETPFYVALDNKHRKIVICVRGTLSLQDVLTDLKADAEPLPLDPTKEEWLGHKGMVQAAIYIKKKLKEDLILAKAFQKAKEVSQEKYDLVLVGHSLGAGTAAILAIMLQQEYQEVQCYAYSPPGGLLSSECVEATKSFITSVVIAKDVVPRIGLHQMELLRTDLINIIKKSKNPKWKIIMKALCCGTESASQLTYDDIKEDLERNVTKHPSDELIGLTAHKPMFPPGKIILVVRKHSGEKKVCGQVEPVYQAIWADNSDFQEVLVSPTMVNDHMPDNVLEALEKVLVNVAPPKPTRLLSEPERSAMLKHDMSPGTPITPLNQSATNLGDQPTVHIVCEKQKDLSNVPVDVYINSNNQGWDAATEELLLSLDKQHLFSSIGHNARLELLDLDSELIQAPLASPEGLSAASSFSALSRTGSFPKSEQRSEVTVAKLATIQQSPDICVRTEDSTENLCEIENKTANSLFKAKSLNESRSVGDFLKKNQFLQPSDLSAIAHASQGSLNNLLPITDYANSQESLNKDTHSIDVPFPQQDTPAIKSNHLNDTDEEKMKHENEENEKMDNKIEGEDVYERHSPTETTQYGYFDPNEIYSAASVGYHPQLLVGGTHSVSLKPSESQKLNTHPANKILQYSQSESRLKGLSDEYQMKRSMEEGDIAHLEDTSNVFVYDKLLKKNLKARGSEPAFNPKSLPKLCNEDKLYSVQETESITSENCDTSDGTFINEKTLENVQEYGSECKSTEIDHTSVDTEDNNSDSEHNDKTCLLKRTDSDSEGRTLTEEVRPRSETGHRKDNSSIGRVSTLSSPDDSDTRLFHSNSCHSTFASSTSGGSEQRLSLISANSEDLPIVETDV